MVLLDTLTAVEHFLDVFIGVYSLRPVQRFLDDVCEPYIRVWRRILPTAGPIDLSPMVAVIALVAFDRIAVAILERVH